MGTFMITAPDGRKYRVTGDNAEGAVQALQKHLGQAAGGDPRRGIESASAAVGPVSRRGIEWEDGKRSSRIEWENEAPGGRLPELTLEQQKAIALSRARQRRAEEGGGGDRLEQMKRALINAHNAGDTEAARTLADAIIAMQPEGQGQAFEAELPDGTIAEFPAGTDRETAQAAIQRHLARQGGQEPRRGLSAAERAELARLPKRSPAAGAEARAYEPTFGDRLYDMAENIGLPAQRMRRDAGRLGAAIDSAGQMLTLNTSDELEAGLRTGAGLWGDYGGTLDSVRRRMEQNRQAEPEASAFGAVAGGLGLGTGMARAGLSAVASPGMAGRGLMARTAAGAGEGTAYGAGYGFGGGEGIEDRLEGAGTGAAIGAGAGAAASLGGSLFARLYTGKDRTPVPSIDEIKVRGSALYDRAFQTGATARPEHVQGMARKMAARLRDFGFDRDLHPGTTAAIRRLQETMQGGEIDFRGLETLRRIAGNAARTDNRSDSAAAHIVIDALDEMIATPTAFAGKGREAFEAIKAARSHWNVARKAETIDDIFRRAELSGSDMGTALRSEFRTLAKRKNGLRGFTDDEKTAIRRFVAGSPATNFVNFLGKRLGTLSATGFSGAAGFTLGGGPIAGLASAAAAAGAGYAARRTGERMMLREAEGIMGNVLRGAPKPATRLPLLDAGRSVTTYGTPALADYLKR